MLKANTCPLLYTTLMKKYGSIKHYIAFLRRQPAHMQHIYAVIFAGSITALLAAIILYVDYGFWHERYVRNEEAATLETKDPPNHLLK